MMSAQKTIIKRLSEVKILQSIYHLIYRIKITLFVALIPVAAVAFFAGCSAVGPDYKQVDVKMSKGWHSELAPGLAGGTLSSSDMAIWWSSFNDPVLSELIDRAIKNNLSLKEALARVREARAQRGISQAATLPTIDGSGSISRSSSSENSGGKGVSTQYFTGFDAGWELDIFGGVRRSIEASEATLQINIEDLNDVMVSLLAETALNYIDVRTYQKRLAIADTNLKSQQETYSLVESQYQAGIGSELDVKQALYTLESVRSKIPAMRTALEEAMNRIAVLLGQRPGELHAKLQGQSEIPVSSEDLTVGFPADTLRNRPDIRMAEQEVALRTAEVGVATAELYPKFTLLGTIALDSLSGGDFLTASSRSWSISPGFSWKLFDAGAIRRSIEVKSAIQEQALIQYQSSVLTALEEVENALVAYAQELELRKTLTSGVDAARDAVKLAQDQYFSGLVDFYDVLDAQRSLFSFEDELAKSNGTVASDMVRLYKVLGGGWREQVTPSEENLKHNKG